MTSLEEIKLQLSNDSAYVLLNNLLSIFLEKRGDVEQNMKNFFKDKNKITHNGDFRKLTLKEWRSGGASAPNPSLVIIQDQEEKKFIFGITRYGDLKPLGSREINHHNVLRVIMDFFTNPERFLPKKYWKNDY